MEDFEKQSYEAFTQGGDFVDVIDSDAGEKLDLAKCSVKAWDRNGQDVTNTVLDIGTMALGDSAEGGTDNVLNVRVRSGSQALSPYIITYYGETNLGEKWEIDVKMKIREKGPVA